MSKLVAIVNVTPDSFSDGGKADAPDTAIAKVDQAFKAGAAVVDIGAQSTRPGALWLSADEEWERLTHVLPEAVALANACGGVVSVDTFHPHVAERALNAGVHWINDVTGFANAAMVDVVASSDCPLVIMHSLGVPPNPALTLQEKEDPVAALAAYFLERLDALEEMGIARERFILDPGIGFGKTPTQSLTLLLRIQELCGIGRPLLVGHSRKSFLTLFTALPAPERDDLTLAFSSVLAAAGVDYLRVHEVQRHAALLSAMDANLPHH